MKIVSIVADNQNVYGLGDDQKIYYWRWKSGEWVLNTQEAFLKREDKGEGK